MPGMIVDVQPTNVRMSMCAPDVLEMIRGFYVDHAGSKVLDIKEEKRILSQAQE